MCLLGGCYIQIFNNSIVGNIRAEVRDGAIIFPKSAKKHNVTVQDSFVRLNLSREQAIN